MPILYLDMIPEEFGASVDSPRARVPFKITGEPSIDVAIALLESTTPAFRTFANYTLLFNDYTIKRTSVDQYEGDLIYGIRQDKRTGSSQYRFDTTGGMQKVTQSKETMGRFVGAQGNTTDIPDFKQAINVNGDRVEGVEIGVRAFAFEETHYVDDAIVTAAYKRTVYDASWTTNNAPFKGLAFGECLFVGCVGSKRGADNWELTYRFMGQPNEPTIQLCDDTTDGGALVVTNKQGWWVLWQWYEEAVGGSLAMPHMVKRPRYAYLERVYDPSDLSLLGIGT